MGRPGPSAPREAALLRINGSQTVCIPKELELPGHKVLIHRDGRRLVIEPVESQGFLSLLEGWEPIPDTLPEVPDPPPGGVDLGA
jgi:antitoxin VapB